ncbi:MAG: hypothetical protein K0Q93_3038 [Nocardioidaceae bacterium]|nr:hypothetical protein [Nocardioidaceae bacterium]
MSGLLARLHCCLAALWRRASAPVDPTEDEELFRTW